MTMFRDRKEAGKRLAKRLEHLAEERPVVLALPRGGVPVAAEIARRLAAPLDLILARKIGAPDQPELAIGAVALWGDGTENAGTVLNREIIAELQLPEAAVARLRAKTLRELAARAARYKTERPPSVQGRCAILVDDGIATGATVEAALQMLRAQEPARVVLAVPVAAQDTAERLAALADEFVCLTAPRHFLAIGAFYADFTQVEDAEVSRLLAEAKARAAGTGS
jgi:putative phosphoribosyl transferase